MTMKIVLVDGGGSVVERWDVEVGEEEPEEALETALRAVSLDARNVPRIRDALRDAAIASAAQQ